MLVFWCHGWRIASVHWAPQPSWEMRAMRFTLCAASPSSLLRMRFSQCAVSLRNEVYPVCSGPLIPNCPWKMRFTQCATSLSSILRLRFTQCAVPPPPSSLLRDDRGVPIVCSGPSSLTEPETWSLPRVQPFPHLWEIKFTSVQPATHHSWEMRFYPMYNQPLTPSGRWSLPSV